MKHPRTIDLIEMAAGRLDPERLTSVQSHLEQCPQCRRELEQVRRTWDILGVWEIHPQDRLDLPGQTPAKGAEAPRIIPFPRFSRFHVALRFAAAVVVTSLVGYVGGRLTGHRTTSALADQPPRYVSALGLDTIEGLSSLVLEDDPPVVEEDRT